MKPDDPRVRDILDRAADLPIDQRPAYLDAACGGDAELRGEVESLLLALDDSKEFLVSPTIGGGAGPGEMGPQKIPENIGPYKLIERLGEGGMGVVYLAEQQQPVRRQVALKIIKPGMDSASVIARFEAERQALALMDHSNIARVYEAGATADGRPYFVMELVQGVSVTKYCDEHRLTPEQRLALFIPICQAVQHAHQKGIIHRDLKPGNILVTVQDGKPLAKVIDFGVAKALHQRLTEKTLFTQMGMLVGTPEYMSPEQAGASPEETDTRSDIYALGVILYELLTGTTPLDRQQLLEAGYEQMMRTIREVEPPRPSTRLSTADDGAASASALRQMEPRKLAKLMIGDLDVIVMKCLEKDRTRRYETADGLARDIERYLNNDPVEASAPSTFYVLRRFAWKHRKPVSVVIAFVLLLAAFLVTTSAVFWVLRNQASRQRDMAVGAKLAADRSRLAESDAKNEALSQKEGANAARAKAEREAYVASIFAAGAAVESGNFADADEFLQLDPVPLRNWEWNYLNAVANPQKLTLRLSGVDGVQYHSDKSEISVILGDGSVQFLDIRSGRLLRTISNLHARGLRPFAVSPDEQRLIAERPDYSICVLGPNGEELGSIPSTSQPHTYVYTTRFTRDHLRFVTSCRDDNSVRIWETANCRELLRLKGNLGLVILTAFNADESRLLTSSNEGAAQVWDLPSGKCISTYHAPGGGWAFSAFSPDGKRVLTVSNDLSRQGVIWDAETGKELLSISEGIHSNANIGVCFSPDGNMVAISGGRFANVFDSHTGHLITVLRGHHARVPGVQFIGDGSELMTGANDDTIRIWDLHPPSRPLVFGSDQQPILRARFSSDGSMLAAELPDQTINIFDSVTGKLRANLDPNSAQNSTDAAFDSTAQYIAAAAHDGTTAIFNAATGKQLRRLGQPGSSAGVCAVTHNGSKAIVQTADGTIRIWDSASGTIAGSFRAAGERAQQIIVSPQDNRFVTVLANGDAGLWDLQSGQLIGPLPGHASSSFHSDDGRNIATSQPTQISQSADAYVFSHDGGSIATASGHAAIIFDAATSKEKLRFTIRHAVIHSVAFSPDDSKIVLSCQDDIAEVWDLHTRAQLLVLHGHQGCLLSACYSPNGTRILTASQDGTARIWDADTGRELLVLHGHTASVRSAVFSGDGTRVLTLSDDGSARVWDSVSAEQRAQRANDLRGR